MSILVHAHVQRAADVKVDLQDGDFGRYAVLSAGDLTVFINDHEKLLELVSLLEKAAQQWEGGE